MLLERLHPLVAYRDCQHCRAFEYDEETGEVKRMTVLHDDGSETEEPKPRGSGRPPCETLVECAKGHHEKPKGMTGRERAIRQHLEDLRAVGRLPADAAVARLAAVLDETERACDRHEQQKTLLTLLTTRLR